MSDQAVIPPATLRAPGRYFTKTVGVFQRLAEAKPMAPPRANEAYGFPGRPNRDARSAEWERMTAVSLAVIDRGVIRLSHHQPLQAKGLT